MSFGEADEPGDVRPMNVDAHIAVQTVQLQHMAKSLERIEAKQEASVPRSEWEQRNGYVDGRFQQAADATRMVAEAVDKLEKVMQAARAPWWVVLGAGLGIVSAVVAVVSVTVK